MKEFAIGALVLAAVTGACAAIFMVLVPLGSLNPNPAPHLQQVSTGAAGQVAMGFMVLLFVGTFSFGVGEGFLKELKNRKKK